MKQPSTAAISGPAAIRWEDIPVELVMPGVRRQVVQGERQTVVRYTYDPGAVFPEHRHEQEQVTVVLSGTLEFRFGDARVRLTPGQAVVIPGNLPHGAAVIGDTIVDTINTLSPKRESHPGI